MSKKPEPFSRGFYVTKKVSDVPLECLNWQPYEINEYVAFVHTSNRAIKSTFRDCSVLIIGTFMDVTNFSETRIETCDRLAISLNKGFDDFYKSINPLAGKFVLFIEKEKNFYCILDATGMLPACWCKSKNDKSVAVSSHPALLARINKFKTNIVAEKWSTHELINAGGAYMPGLLTDYENIYSITPNQIFSFAEAKMVRFYPKNEIIEKSAEEAALEIFPLLQGQIKKLVEEGKKLYVGLSGGLDTRCTLSITSEMKDNLEYFTYYNNGKILSTDLEIAEKLSKRFNLKHHSINLSKKPLTSEHKDLIVNTENLLKKHASPFSAPYAMSSLLNENSIHICSNVLEIARGFYLKNKINIPQNYNSEKLSRLFRTGTYKEFEPYFKEFFDKTSFNDISEYKSFHYSDMFYWEHRLPINYGQMYRAADCLYETYIIYNCRTILELFLSVSLEERRNAYSVFYLISIGNRDLLDIPIQSGSKFIDPLEFEKI